MKLKKKKILKVGGRGSGGGGGRVRMDVNEELKFCENSTKKIGGEGSQGRCEHRSVVFVKIQEKNLGGGGGWVGFGGVRVDVIREVKFL